MSSSGDKSIRQRVTRAKNRNNARVASCSAGVVGYAVVVAAIVGCGGSSGSVRYAVLRPGCAPDQADVGDGCRLVAGRADLNAGRDALAKFEVESAQKYLEAAAQKGPLDLGSHVTLWEQRGIAAAYVNDESQSLRAFATLLALDPGHLLSYALSPRATFAFEKARTSSAKVQSPTVQVTWRRDLRVGDPLPIDVELVANPQATVRRATLMLRARGQFAWRAADLDLRASNYRHVVLPPIAGTKPATVELYLRAFDEHDNEVLRWADAGAPREMALRYEPPTPWYKKWWVWATIGTAIAGGTGGIMYAVTRDPPEKVSGTVVSH